MKGFIAFSMMTLASALPQDIGEGKPKPIGSNMASTIASLRDGNGLLDGGVGPKIRNEVLDKTPCGDIVFIFARASMEPTNMVSREQSVQMHLT
jgi:hypothetical protein